MIPERFRIRDAERVDPVEARNGRVHWTGADYLAEGRRLFDEAGHRQRVNPWAPSDREGYARGYRDVTMPIAKQRAELAARKANADAQNPTESTS